MCLCLRDGCFKMDGLAQLMTFHCSFTADMCSEGIRIILSSALLFRHVGINSPMRLDIDYLSFGLIPLPATFSLKLSLFIHLLSFMCSLAWSLSSFFYEVAVIYCLLYHGRFIDRKITCWFLTSMHTCNTL